ncbi:MAG: GNAT family N-acetyltransferase [Pirellulales bacterium]
MISIVRESRDSESLIQLVRLLDAYLEGVYGAVQAQYTPFNALASIDGAVIAYDEKLPIGCGCYKRFADDTAEIKRMFVRPEHRCSGVAALVLAEVENWALEAGYSRAVLETGIKQPEAIRFYQKSGYARIENYGQYVGMENSLCMAKLLVAK